MGDAEMIACRVLHPEGRPLASCRVCQDTTTLAALHADVARLTGERDEALRGNLVLTTVDLEVRARLAAAEAESERLREAIRWLSVEPMAPALMRGTSLKDAIAELLDTALEDEVPQPIYDSLATALRGATP